VRPDKLMEASLPENVYVTYERLRDGYVWKFKDSEMEIAFRPFGEVRKWNRIYEVAGHVARRGLREKGLL
jgi:hypothetical protein